jgi:hypothetical protein
VELWELVARESVRDLVARYNANGDNGRLDQMVALFTDDAVLETDGSSVKGHAAIHGFFADAARMFGGSRGFTHLRHFTSTQQIDIQSNIRATSRCYFAVIMDHGLDHWGRYLDDFGFVQERWLITGRRVLVDGRVANSVLVSGDRRSP